METARGILQGIGDYSRGRARDGQVDQDIVERCAALATKSDLCADDVKAVLDECACYSRCTDFVMVVLDYAWRDLKPTL